MNPPTNPNQLVQREDGMGTETAYTAYMRRKNAQEAQDRQRTVDEINRRNVAPTPDSPEVARRKLFNVAQAPSMDLNSVPRYPGSMAQPSGASSIPQSNITRLVSNADGTGTMTQFTADTLRKNKDGLSSRFDTRIANSKDIHTGAALPAELAGGEYRQAQLGSMAKIGGRSFGRNRNGWIEINSSVFDDQGNQP